MVRGRPQCVKRPLPLCAVLVTTLPTVCQCCLQCVFLLVLCFRKHSFHSSHKSSAVQLSVFLRGLLHPCFQCVNAYHAVNSFACKVLSQQFAVTSTQAVCQYAGVAVAMCYTSHKCAFIVAFACCVPLVCKCFQLCKLLFSNVCVVFCVCLCLLCV